MIKLSIEQVVSSLISLFMLYIVMEPVSFAHSESTVGKISDMLSASIVWVVMILFVVKDFNTALYNGLISKLIK